jgi:NADPH:quinone reductase-like Zn-dependent oxidoreductase
MPPAWLLVNGAGGGVGGFTVQLAKEAGAIVIATASPRSTDTVRAFGADHIVDYTATTIAEAVKDPVDMVVNLVAGSREDTEALLDVTKPGGVLVSATSPGACSDLVRGSSCPRPWPVPRPSVARTAPGIRRPRTHSGRRQPANATRSASVLVSGGWLG